MALLAVSLFLLSRLSARGHDHGHGLAARPIRGRYRGFHIAQQRRRHGAVPPLHRGIACGSVATARNLGMVIGVASAGLIFNSTFRQTTGGQDWKVYHPSLEPSFMAAFHNAMLARAAVVCIGFVVAYLRGRGSGHAGR